jgi:hypothetical protein
MKYLCLGYGNRAKMDALPKEELRKILRQCVPWVEVPGSVPPDKQMDL